MKWGAAWINLGKSEACDNDENCKGFAEFIEQDKDGSVTGKQYGWYSKGCEYATVNGASTCKSSGCTYYESDMEKTNNWGNIGIGNLLGPNYGTHYCGCWRKVIKSEILSWQKIT